MSKKINFSLFVNVSKTFSKKNSEKKTNRARDQAWHLKMWASIQKPFLHVVTRPTKTKRKSKRMENGTEQKQKRKRSTKRAETKHFWIRLELQGPRGPCNLNRIQMLMCFCTDEIFPVLPSMRIWRFLIVIPNAILWYAIWHMLSYVNLMLSSAIVC